MATRRTRRIADLVTEEVQKTTANNQPEPEATEEVAQATGNGASTSTKTADQVDHNQENLAAIVAELRTNLVQIQQREKSLQQQIADLQSTLDKQNKFVSKLQQEIESSASIKAELDQAKRTVLQLAETNSKLIEQMSAGKPEPKQELKPESKESKIQKHKIPIYHTIVGKEQTGDNTDFASKSWLL